MLWSFIAVCLSAWLFVDASYRGPAWQRWVFKPLTLLLLALLAWQAPMFNAKTLFGSRLSRQCSLRQSNQKSVLKSHTFVRFKTPGFTAVSGIHIRAK